MLNLNWPISHNERIKAVSTASDDSASTATQRGQRAKATVRKCSDEATKNLISFNDSVSAKSLRSEAARCDRCAIAVVVGEYVRHNMVNLTLAFRQYPTALKSLNLKVLMWIFLLGSPGISFAQLHLAYNYKNESIVYALARLKETTPLVFYGLQQLSSKPAISPHLILLSKAEFSNHPLEGVTGQDFEPIREEGFVFKWLPGHATLCLLYQDAVGAIYGLAEVREAWKIYQDLNTLENKTANPRLEYRIIKFNLPWSPYRNHKAVTLHETTCRDLKFWGKFLDMMVDNRFNALSLWNIHPFPFMISSKSFPLANDFSEAEMKSWQNFWKGLFRMAKIRGIQTFVVNWNIAVSPEFAKAYKVSEYSDLSDTVKAYTRECVTQLIDEYPDLTGIGVTLADWMGTFDEKMSPQQREDWIEETFIAGMQAASRPVKFIHRSVLAGDPLAMRNLLDKARLPEPALVEIKFNWSHGHSTPHLAITHDYHSGKLDERFWSPLPLNYKIQWMIRNEDFFVLRWGQPDFIRTHIKTNSAEYVNGYFIGSEGYIPAVDYSSHDSVKRSWTYAFEKQWLFYALWGRLLYNPDLSDKALESLMVSKYGEDTGLPLFKAYQLVSNMPLRLASFHRSTWDYTLFSEGFMAPVPSNPNGFVDRSSPFISIDEFIHHETLDPNLYTIPQYVNKKLNKIPMPDSMMTPLQLAMLSSRDSRLALKYYEEAKTQGLLHVDLKSEWDDVATWAYLGLYFSEKLQAGIALHTFRKLGKNKEKIKAIAHLEAAKVHWLKVIELTRNRYKPTPHVALQGYKDYSLFSWEGLLPQVEKDLEIAKSAKWEMITKPAP